MSPPDRAIGRPNPGKSCCTSLDGETWTRIPVHTGPIGRETNLEEQVATHVVGQGLWAWQDHRHLFTRPWFVAVSEKVVAITQGRSFPVDQVRVSTAARVLSRFVVRTPHGIGLGHPATMQLAISEAGLPRILLAAGVSAVGKLLGRRGWFYRVAGHHVDTIDGPTANSMPPSDVSAKLPPLNPDRVARELEAAVKDRLRHERGWAARELEGSLAGVAVIDASDLGCQVLGASSRWLLEATCRLFADNPLGQDRQSTPFCIVVRTDQPPPEDDPNQREQVVRRVASALDVPRHMLPTTPLHDPGLDEGV